MHPETPSKKSSSTWRMCPAGYHWRSAHSQKTYAKADGTVVHEHLVNGSCCRNPSKKDRVYSDELLEIAKQYFPKLTGGPAANDLGFKKSGNIFDEYIRGWTQFWNQVLRPDEELDPNLVKALIATESSFNPNPKVGPAKARGLMQVTDQSRKILGDAKGELTDHLVYIDQKDITDPNLNIAAGVRWLFQKKKLAGVRLGRTATWDEAVAEYKSYLDKMIKDPKLLPRPMGDFRNYYKRLIETK